MRRAFTTAAAITVVLLGASATADALTASAGTASSQASTSHGRHIIRFNVGKTHSPKLESLMAPKAIAPKAALQMRPAGLPSVASTVQGIDVASFQHPNGAAINWSQVAQAGYKFAFIKGTEGSYYTNPYYAGDASGAKSAGLLVAPYAFAIPNYSGGALQADYALDRANYGADGRTLPLILDIEYDPYAAPVSQGGDGTNSCYGLTASQLVAWITAFANETSRRTGQPPVIYTTADWWHTCTGDSAAFAADPLWVASYATSPVVPAPWASAWTYWQYTNKATPPGVSGTTDASWLSSTALELAAPGSQSDQVSSTVSRQLTALDGGGAVTFSATGLPTGVQIDASTGALTGTLPVTAAPFQVSVTASATGDASVTQSFTWNAHGKPSFGTLASQTGSVGSPVRYQVPASDGLSGCTLRFSATGLPPGLGINSCGLITGWPATGGHYTVNVQVTDNSGGALATGSFAWTIGRAAGTGPAGHIVLRSNGKCLAGLSTTSIAIETCGTATNQHWTVAADGSLRVNGSCLAAKAVTSSAPAGLTLTSCTSPQRWQAGSKAVLTNTSNGRCLADTGSSNGAAAVAAVCQATFNNTGSSSTPSTSQQWTLPAGPLASGIPGNCASNVRSAGQQIGAVTLRGCNGTSAQAWSVQPTGQLQLGTQCLGLTAGATTPGTRVRLGPCTTAPSQIWQVTGGPIGIRILNPLAGLCLSDPGDSATAGTQLVIGPCVASDPGILWRVS
ncbi:MAG TPA: GH25 family lysozyme [Streptosporangiaceae bacterium]|nr:GH25 family lysozyme [Streptosporangiaceae bacterium]